MPADLNEAVHVPAAASGVVATLARNWWAFALRGLAALFLGVAAPLNGFSNLCDSGGATLAGLVSLFGQYALLDGALYIAAAH